jgi:hypothetical protein
MSVDDRRVKEICEISVALRFVFLAHRQLAWAPAGDYITKAVM